MIFAGAMTLLLLAWPNGLARAPERTVAVRHQQIILRMPVSPMRGSRVSLGDWRESRGPRCLTATTLAGATAPGPRSIDLVLRDRTRMRARLDRGCAALDFYRGFYIHALPDGRICADRDWIHLRSGGECRIDQFRTLTLTRR